MKNTNRAYLLWCLCFVGVAGMHRFYLGKPISGLIWLLTWGLLGMGQILDWFFLSEMVEEQNLKEKVSSLLAVVPKNSSLDRTSAELEIEAIKRFRDLCPILPINCQVCRVVDDNLTVLCLDFVDCPQELDHSIEQFPILAVASHQLGLAESLIFKIGDRIIAQTKMTENT